MISNRNPKRAQILAHEFGAKSVEWEARNRVATDIIINCTPVGMHPNVDETPYPKAHLKPSMLIFDTVYNPESTLLVNDARARMCKVVTGVEMFIRQAALQYLLFTGQEAPSDLMRDVLKRTIGPVRY